MAKIIILGANSFSGAGFIDFLLQNHDDDIIAISRSKQDKYAYLPYLWNLNNTPPKFIQYDLNKNFDEICHLITQEKPDYIVNYAAQSMVGESWDNPQDWFMTNALTMTNFFKFLTRCDFLQRYVHITTPEVYGSTNGFIDETQAFNPSTPYAVSRAAGDMSLLAYADSYDLPIVMTRAANIYGAGQPLYRIIPRTVFSALNHEKFTLHGGGVSQRCFIHIDDVNRATNMLMRSNNLKHQCYHIADDKMITIRTLVEKIIQMLNIDFGDIVDMGAERLGKDDAYQLSTKRITQEFAWQAQITLDDGIQQVIGWAKKFADDVQNYPRHYIHKP